MEPYVRSFVDELDFSMPVDSGARQEDAKSKAPTATPSPTARARDADVSTVDRSPAQQQKKSATPVRAPTLAARKAVAEREGERWEK